MFVCVHVYISLIVNNITNKSSYSIFIEYAILKTINENVLIGVL